MDPKDIILILAALAIVSFVFLVLKALFKKLQEEEKMKYEFVTIIAHKFRTPLSQVKWLMEGVLEKEKDPYILEDLKNVQQSNEKLISLTNTLIEVTDSAQKGRLLYTFEPVNLPTFVNDVVDSLKSDFHTKNIFYSVTCTQPEIVSNIDRSRMRFVLETILENSITYSPVGRNVKVEISKKGRHAMISIADDGIGIDPSDMKHIFTKFFRSEEAKRTDTEGFGIALYLARIIVGHHKGELKAFSEGLGKGSVFTITLRSIKG